MTNFESTPRDTTKVSDSLPTPVAQELNPLGYPIGYFDPQVRFAQKWAILTGEGFDKVLLHKTALYRRLFGAKAPQDSLPQEWVAILQGNDANTPSDCITGKLFEHYSHIPDSRYTPPEHPRAIGYDYYPDRRVVKIHFNNPKRGTSPFSAENMLRLRSEFKEMLDEIRTTHPEAETLVSASWVRSTKGYRSLSPPDIAEQVSLMSTDMAFGGDSVWGQFLDKFGQTNQRTYRQFVVSVQAARSLDELLAAFPYQVLKAEDPIVKYYRYYGIETP